jgi:hypothetical protein
LEILKYRKNRLMGDMFAASMEIGNKL